MRGVIGGRAVDGSKVTGAITDVDTVGSSLSTVQVAVDKLALGAAATGHQSVRIHGLDVTGEGLAPAGVSGVHLGDGLLDGTGDKLAGAVGFVGVDWERPLDFDDGVAGNGGLGSYVDELGEASADGEECLGEHDDGVGKEFNCGG